MWSLEQPEWHCKIDEGSIGLLSSRWSPDGRHILNTTEFHVSVKLVRARMHAPECVCAHACLGSTVAGPQGRGGLKIARHQSLSRLSLPTPPPPPPTHPLPPPSPPTHPLHGFSLISLMPCCLRPVIQGSQVPPKPGAMCVLALCVGLGCPLRASARGDVLWGCFVAQIIKVVKSRSKQKYLHGHDQVKMTLLNEVTWVDCLLLNEESKTVHMKIPFYNRSQNPELGSQEKVASLLAIFREGGGGVRETLKLDSGEN